MKRLLTFLCVLAVAVLPMRADEYRDALLGYLMHDNHFSAEEYQQTLRQAVESAFPDSKDPAVQALAAYASEQMMTDITDIFLPTFREHVTIDELQQMSAIYSDPRYAELQQRAGNMLSEMQHSPEYEQLVATKISSAFSDIAAGYKPHNLSAPRSVPKEYVALFRRYYEVSGMDGIVRKSFAALTDMLSSRLREQGVENAAEIAQQVVDYMTTNIPTAMVTFFHKTFPQDDLQLLIDATDSEAYHHVMEATTEIVSDPLSLSAELIMKMSDWVSGRYPDLADRFGQLAEAMDVMAFPTKGEVVIPEVQPEYPGGFEAMYQFIGSHMVCPPELLREGFQGKVVCRFVINRDGSLIDAEVMRTSGNEAVDRETLRVLNDMPKWNPGRMQGKIVRSSMAIPIKVKIDPQPVSAADDKTKK